jgi:hypothetical protein
MIETLSFSSDLTYIGFGLIWISDDLRSDCLALGDGITLGDGYNIYLALVIFYYSYSFFSIVIDFLLSNSYLISMFFRCYFLLSTLDLLETISFLKSTLDLLPGEVVFISTLYLF